MNTNHIEQFRAAMQAAGLTAPEQIVDDGKLHRFRTNGKAHDDAGWYLLHGDGIPAGAFGCWRSHVSETFRADIGRELTLEEAWANRERMDSLRREREAERERRHAQARQRAQEILAAAPPAPADHEYLRRKALKPHALKAHDGALIVPMRDEHGLCNLQFIHPDGAKRFLPGAKVSGAFHEIGEARDRVVICEGAATGYSLHEATGLPVRCAMSAGNLSTIAKLTRRESPSVEVIIAGDHDKSGAGQRAALEAARAVNGLLAIPTTEGHDWNDVQAVEGLDAVRAGIEGARELAAQESDSGPAPEPPIPLEAYQDEPRANGKDNPGAAINTALFTLLWFAALDGYVPAEQIVKGLLFAGSLFVVYGESNSGKTFFVLDLALAIASGSPWRSRRTRRGLVIYVAGEGAASVRARVAAYRLARPNAGGLPFAIVPQAVNFMDAVSVATLIATIRAAESEAGEKVTLIIIDTFARALPGADENSAQDVGTAVAWADRIREETGAAVGFVHHAGKDPAKGARGSSALRAATDTEILIEGVTGQRTATITKQRDLNCGEAMPFQLVSVQIGTDAEDGSPITSCTVKHLEATAATAQAAYEFRGKAQRQFLRVLRTKAEAEPGRFWSLSDLRQLCREAGFSKATARSVVDAIVASPYMTFANVGYVFTDGEPRK